MPVPLHPPPGLDHRPEQGTLLINKIEQKSRWCANETFMRYPTANWETDGYKTLTWGHFGDAINKVAFWLDENLDNPTQDKTVAYFGTNDLRYSVLLPAVVKTGRTLLVPDGRVTDDGLNKLLEQTGAKAWIFSDDGTRKPPTSLPTNLRKIALPSVEWCLDAPAQKPYPYQKTWDEGKWDVAYIIHTSGTTGVPKPIYHTNGFLSAVRPRELAKLHYPRGTVYDSWVGRHTLSPFPPQWLGGLFHYLIMPVMFDCIAVIPPSEATTFSVELVQKIIQLNPVAGIQAPPHTITQFWADEEGQTILKGLEFVVFAGAPLDQKVGDELTQYTKLSALIGSTETGPQVSLQPADRIMWHTLDYVPENGHRMVRLEGSGAANDGSDDLYELCLKRPADGEPSLFQPAFWNPMFKDLDIIETKELYAPVKDTDGRTRWVFSTRKDDLTKLEWLAKFHAQDIEKRIQKHPDVSSVFVGGEGRPTPYVIVEPNVSNMGKEEADALIDDLYRDVISKNNDGNIHEIRIPRETVFPTRPAKPFKRTLKHTLMRKEIEKDYSEEIEEAYVRLAHNKR